MVRATELAGDGGWGMAPADKTPPRELSQNPRVQASKSPAW